jgi:hypothetical protein
MKLNYLAGVMLFLLVIAQAQDTGLRPFPGANSTTDVKATGPMIPPMVSQILVAGAAIVIGLIMITIFLVVIALVLKWLFGSKKPIEAEVIRKNRIADCKGWNGSELSVVELAGDGTVQPSIHGWCTGFKAEGEWDYITYHTGLPGYMFLFKMLKGPRFQLFIPIVDIMIPPDHIIQLHPKEHTPPGRRILVYASGIRAAHSGYEMANTSLVTISERMKHERDDVIARMHGETASLLPKLAEDYWEAKQEHFKKKGAESSKASAGK